jgi:hypothetical protein
LDRGIERKNFFFEKKKQKTFVSLPPGDVEKPRVKRRKSFWGAVFQEGALFLHVEKACSRT